jgi:predicted metal-dependent peptidase
MSNIYEDLSKIGKQLMISEPFYGIFMSTLNKVVRKDIPTAGVSKHNINYQLAINEDFWNSLDNDKKKIGLLKHELLHICFNHLEDREWYPDQELHNVAADLEINQYLTPEYYPTPEIILLSSFPELSLPEKAGTKVYYELLQQALDKGTSPSLQELMDGLNGIGDLDGDGGGGLHPTWKEFDGMSEADAKLAKAQIEHQIKGIINEHKNQSRGFIPSELQSWIDNMFEDRTPAYDWKAYFRRFFSSSSKIYTKKTRRKLNKRFSENPELKIKPKKNVLVGVDTSGSVSEKDLIEFFTEIQHMYKTGVTITVAEGDADIHKVYEYKGNIPDKITGRGGTDMNPFIEYFNKHKEFNSLIILTDGYIGSRTVQSFKPTLLVICSNGESIETVKNEGWGNTIKINLD